MDSSKKAYQKNLTRSRYSIFRPTGTFPPSMSRVLHLISKIINKTITHFGRHLVRTFETIIREKMETKISFLFKKNNPKTSEWVDHFSYYPALQKQRLSWRECDHRFASFIDFLESHGANTNLDQNEWEKILNIHLSYILNRHFLFMLWMGVIKRNGAADGNDPTCWLPDAHAAQFADWARRERADAAIMESLETVSLAEVPRPMPAFRGTPLRSVFMYRAFQKVIGLHAQPPKE